MCPQAFSLVLIIIIAATLSECSPCARDWTQHFAASTLILPRCHEAKDNTLPLMGRETET